MNHLLPLRERAIGRLDFQLESLIHIGMGGAEARRELLKIEENVIISSSTIKGAFRRTAEWLAKDMVVEDLPQHYSIDEDGIRCIKGKVMEMIQWLLAQGGEVVYDLISLGFEDELNSIEIREEGDWEKLQATFREEESKLLPMAEAYATLRHPLYRLFGGKRIASKLRFLDALFHSRHVDKPGVGIDRKAGRASGRRLFFLETAVPSSVSIWFIADNLIPKTDDAKLFAQTLDMIREMGLSIGVRKSTGMGMMTLIGGECWIVRMEDDVDGTSIANPFKGASRSLEEFLKRLRT